MKRTLGTLAALALAVRAALAASPAELNVVAFDGETPLAAAIVEVDGDAIGATNADGTAQLQLQPGKRVIVLRRDGAELLRYEIEVAEGENAELIATLRDGAEPSVQVESSLGARQTRAAAAPTAAADGPPGTLRGRIVSSENGAPIANARVFVSGTPLDLRTDADGRFEARLPPGTYAISVIAADYAAQTLEGLAIAAEQATTRDVELTPAGLELPEFVVLEPYVQGSLASFVEEKRESFAVAEVLGIEQISRAGDSDVAGALRRVTGLTLVDGKYVYVRGLGERYSSVLLNGAPVPSPDPSRRVVPLDLFPVEILSGVVIQKSFSAEMPGEFGGGTIQLRTKGIPEDFFLKVQVGQGWGEGTTFEDGLRYRAGTQDWTGFDQTRGLPDSIIEANARFGRLLVQTPFSEGLTPDEIQAIGRDLAGQGFDVAPQKIGTNGSFTLGVGDAFELGEDWRLGYVHSTRYSQGWDTTDDDLRRKYAFVAEGEPLTPVTDFLRSKTERSIDLSGFLALGVEYGDDHRLISTTTLVRQTIDTAQVDEGLDITESISRFFFLEWEENALLSQQFNGEHRFPGLMNLGLDWNWTRARATRSSPNTREYRYVQLENDGPFSFSTTSDANAITFSELTDESTSYGLNLNLPIVVADAHTLTVLGGATKLDRDRDAEVRRYNFTGSAPAGAPPGFREQGLDDILAPGNIAPDRFFVREVSRNSDAYVALQELEAAYLTLDWMWADVLRLTLGARDESNLQEVRTFSLVNPSQVDSEASIQSSDLLPSASATWFIDEDSQLRLIYAETVSRPDFRELSTSPFIDPLIDTTSIGNPDLVPAAIKNLDVRYEYYFSPTETFSVAVFAKDFTNPIERIQSPATGDVVTYENVPAATLYGIEFDLYKSLDFVDGWEWLDRGWLGRVPWSEIFVGANYARIESDVELTRETAGISTNLERPLQGQSPYVANLQVGWQPEDGESEATLLYTVAGRRISEVGVFGIPDVFEEPAGQLDVVFARDLWTDWKLKVRLRNLLDPTIEFTVGEQLRRQYKRGREVAITLEWSP
ncbi:MAG: TonB-dependent receptor domain-containing protein [Pseudomonadota bacterium]